MIASLNGGSVTADSRRADAHRSTSATVEEVAPLDELLSQTGNNRGLIVELIEIFESESSNMIAELRRSLAANDAKGVQAAAHRFRGSLRIFRVSRALDVAVDLESMGRAGVLDRAQARVRELETDVDGALERLRSYRAQLTP